MLWKRLIPVTKRRNVSHPRETWPVDKRWWGAQLAEHPQPTLPTALSFGWALPGHPPSLPCGPRESPPRLGPGKLNFRHWPWEAQLQTLPLRHQPVPASFPTAGDFSGCCRGGRVRREDGWPRGMKLDALSGSLFLARSSSPSRSNQNYWKHLCPWQGLRNENQACSDKELHTESKFFFKGFRELSNKI